MGVYADTLADLNTKLDRAQYEYDCIDGTQSVTIKIFLDETVDAPQVGRYAYSQYDRDGITPIHTLTGTGGAEQMAADWRSANSSVTSGDMYNVWNHITTADATQKNTDKALMSDFITYLTRKKAHYQSIVDNGEDPTGLDLEDMATIEALAP